MRYRTIYTLMMVLFPLLATAQNYAIMVPQKATDVELAAANEFKYFAKEAVGEDIPIVLDSSMNDSTLYISIGKTLLAGEVYERYAPKLKWDGFAVHSDGGNLYLVG